ncbi:hypothetical protein LXA43DRAFT_1101239 [Ganoderma leucocontextum]|nr:hypothetical protein LXA43DRAFT_1101239 [Ganoderma leucocontextum]
MPVPLRRSLEQSIETCMRATSDNVHLRDIRSPDDLAEFITVHFSHYMRMGQDLKAHLGDLYYEIACYAEEVPGRKASPCYPFAGFVLNFNVATKGHRDSGDLKACLVIPIGTFQGAEEAELLRQHRAGLLTPAKSTAQQREAEDQRIRNRNNQLMAEERAEEAQLNSGASSPTSTSYALRGKEVTFANSLPQVSAFRQEEDLFLQDREDERDEHEQEDGEDGGEGTTLDAGQEAVENGSEEELLAVREDNGIVFSDDESSAPRRMRTRKSGKITESDFTPRQYRLATAAKAIVRESIALHDAFPKNPKQLCADSLTKKDEVLEDKLASYAMGGLRSELKHRIKGLIGGYYNIPGNMEVREVEDVVKWLQEKSNFTCANVRTQERTATREEPFASEAIRDIIRQHWFGRGKADILAYNHFCRTQAIPGPTIVLVATILGHCLGEWSKGHFEALHFSDDQYSSMYRANIQRWNLLAQRSPTYIQELEKNTFQTIMKASHKTHLTLSTAPTDDFDDVDLSAIEARAVLRAQQQGTS